MLTLRPAVPADAALLERMLVLAVDWRPDCEPRPVAAMLAVPELAHYINDWPRAGDLGVIASLDGKDVGAAWWRYFDNANPGFGYIADDVPEISIAVANDVRRQGVGQALMQRLIEEARTRSVKRLSLSVEVDNPARLLYEQLGFAVIDAAGDPATMLLELD